MVVVVVGGGEILKPVERETNVINLVHNIFICAW